MKITQETVALVTGASRGIGVYIVSALAERGCKMVLAARSREGLERSAEIARAAGAEVLIVPTDLAQRDSLTALVDAVLALEHDFQFLLHLLLHLSLQHAADLRQRVSQDEISSNDENKVRTGLTGEERLEQRRSSLLHHMQTRLQLKHSSFRRRVEQEAVLEQ